MEKETPSSLGFKMPAEWHKHEATWISWPHNEITWEDPREIEPAYLAMISTLSHGEKVEVLVNDEKEESRARALLKNSEAKSENVCFHRIPTVDAWIRDYGPNFIVKESEKKVAFNHWDFNAWGDKYEDLKLDKTIPDKINQILNKKKFCPGIVLEGGSIDVNGEGLCLTTESCLLNKNRNPKLTKNHIESYLRSYLGVKDVVWLKEGIAGDDTDGHIDDVARFVAKDRIICSYDDKKENKKILDENLDILEQFSSRMGFKVIRIPIPQVKDSKGLLPASYCNFYIGNSAVLVPIFGEENDDEAIKIIKREFPKKNVVPINCRKFVYGLGTLHCASQQQPGF